MIAARMCGASFGAEWVAVCTALSVWPRMPCPRGRGGSNGAGFPPLRTRGVLCSSQRQALKGRARRLCLAPTIQAEGEAFQGGALAYAGSKKRSSYSAYATAKGRSQPPYWEGKPGAEVAPACGAQGIHAVAPTRRKS